MADDYERQAQDFVRDEIGVDPDPDDADSQAAVAKLASAIRRAALLEAEQLLRKRAAEWRALSTVARNHSRLATDADAAADAIRALAEAEKEKP